MGRLYRAAEIADQCKTAKKTLDFASEWIGRTACGKLVLSKDEVSALLEFCAALSLSVDANLDAFEKAMKERDEAASRSNPSKEKEEPKTAPIEFHLQDEAEEQAWQTMSGCRLDETGSKFFSARS